MTVKELREELKDLPDDLDVVVDAGEFSYFKPERVSKESRFWYNNQVPNDPGIGPVIVLWTW